MADDFQDIFNALHPLYRVHADACVVLRNEAMAYYLGTHEVRAKDGYRTDFGGVEIKKAHVSAHLMPVYVHPDMLDQISPALRKRMQGKSCFNFRTMDRALFEELNTLITAGVARFKQDGRL
ncbi:hypothetical protein [Pseudosulfitobacter sp. SM2401]|uniref:hypothetical protein n=1 Tax=Pseudosulfitobacter sp. SM2401 TaxID=3350098 RepID=UPI0036F2667D